MAKTRFGDLDGIHSIRKNSIATTVAISICIFAAVLIIFLLLVAGLNKNTLQQQRESLENAIDRGMLQCYVTEGRYPESFEYLQEKYGIIYDDSRFRVDYEVFGTNMRPTVTIIELEAK